MGAALPGFVAEPLLPVMFREPKGVRIPSWSVEKPLANQRQKESYHDNLRWVRIGMHRTDDLLRTGELFRIGASRADVFHGAFVPSPVPWMLQLVVGR